MRFLIPRGLQARLALSHLFVSLISISLISIYAGQVLLNAVRREVEHRYEDLAYVATNQLEKPLLDYLQGSIEQDSLARELSVIFASATEIEYTLYLPDGQPVADRSGSLPAAATPDNAPDVYAALAGGEAEFSHWDRDGKELLFLSVRVKDDNDIHGVLRMGIPIQETLDAARNSLLLLIGTALLVAVAVSAAGYWLSRSLAGPIRELTNTAESVTMGNLDARAVTPSTPHELHRLAQAFNEMAGRLQAHVTELRIFVANASHELRTPLTSIKLRVEALRSGALEDSQVAEQFLAEIESEVDRLSTMVNDLLDLSRIEAGLEKHQRQHVNLSTVVEEIYETFLARANRAGIELTRDVAAEPVMVIGSEDQLRRMISNLVENAIKYTRQGGKVDLVLQKAPANGSVRLVVRDNGFGISREHLPHIFERFYRVEATRPRYGPPQGSGLGLAIARSIVETHGGRIGVTSQLGKGSAFWVELPLESAKGN